MDHTDRIPITSFFLLNNVEERLEQSSAEDSEPAGPMNEHEEPVMEMHQISRTTRRAAMQAKFKYQDLEDTSTTSSRGLEDEEYPEQESLTKEDEDLIHNLTGQFKHTYRTIEKLLPPNLKAKKKEVQQYIKQQKEKIAKRLKRKCRQPTFTTSDIDNYTHKRFKSMRSHQELLEQAHYIINSFSTLQTAHQDTICKIISHSIEQDPKLFQNIFDAQLASKVDQVVGTPHANEAKLLALFDLPLQQKVLLNLKVAARNDNFIKPRTLSLTLLPALNQCCDYAFIEPSLAATAVRLVETLIPYILSTSLDIQTGFVHFLLELKVPEMLTQLMLSSKYSTVVQQAFTLLNLGEQTLEIILDTPSKFFWSNLLEFLESLNGDIQLDIARIVSKVIVQSEPKDQINQLYDIVSNTPLIRHLLLKPDQIQLDLDGLVMVLSRICNLAENKVKECLNNDTTLWSQKASQLQNKNDQHVADVSEILSFYKSQTSHLEQALPFEECRQLSLLASSLPLSKYSHDEYQCAIAGIVISHNNPVTMVVIPPASGKSFIIGLLALHYIAKGLKTQILVPNTLLQNQLYSQIGAFSEDIIIRTASEYYQFMTQADVLIVDEFDDILTNNAYSIDDTSVEGIWSFKKSMVIGLTATLGQAEQKVISSLLGKPLNLVFKSPYEFHQKTVTLFDRSFKTFSSESDLLKELVRDITGYLERKPVICFLSGENRDLVLSELQDKTEIYCDVELCTLKQLASKTRGLLVLDKSQNRGYDTKFKTDAIVLVACKVDGISELNQMLGRASRSRQLCQGQIYCVSKEQPDQILQRLEEQCFVDMQNRLDLCNFLRYVQQLEAKQKARYCKVMRGAEVSGLGDIKRAFESGNLGSAFKKILSELHL